MVKKAMIACIRGYKKFISPMLGTRCRFLPTCSEYAMQAIEVHGPIKGILLGSYRLLRCNPLGKFGYDPVPEKGHWINPERKLYKE